MGIHLREITKDNFEECYDLKVSKEQEEFVAPNAYSMLEMKYIEGLEGLAIYDDETMVGFIMSGIDDEDGRMYMCRLMIDHRFQKRGYGAEAVKLLIRKIRDKHGDIDIYTSIEPENHTAGKVYERLGFKKTGDMYYGEILMLNKL